jgi:hypothetical protein
VNVLLGVRKTRGAGRRPAVALRTVERSAILGMDLFNQLLYQLTYQSGTTSRNCMMFIGLEHHVTDAAALPAI